MARARRVPLAGAVLLFVSAAAPSRAQEGDALDALLNRLGNYLLDYEGELSTVIASERYDQRELRLPRRSRITPTTQWEVTRQRTLDSDVAFLRLPGGASWLGIRDVLKVDGRAVQEDEVSLQALIKRLDRGAVLDEAARIVAASSVFNLGGIRTINMPTTPLEVLHPDRHVQFVFKLRGTDRIDGVTTARLEFEEFDVPTIISNPEGDPLFIRGSAWIEPDSGRIWRVELTIRPKPEARVPARLQSTLRVDFMLQRDLNMMVPKEMTEDFYVAGGRGTGKAKYSNYRRFGTSGRIVPH
jgi:hypothetical protein